MDIIFTDKACPPKGHYHQAVRHNGILYLSGILGITQAGDPVSGGMIEEAKQVFENLTEILKAGNSGIDKLLRVTVYVHDMESWGEVNKMYAAFLGEHKCARSIVPVNKLPFGLNMELEATAVSE
jgi:2-iminobutanoate/2-iminopropanoate deaminase